MGCSVAALYALGVNDWYANGSDDFVYYALACSVAAESCGTVVTYGYGSCVGARYVVCESWCDSDVAVLVVVDSDCYGYADGVCVGRY